VAVWAAFIMLTFFYLIPIGAIQALINIDQLRKIHVFAVIIDLPVIKSIIVAILPGAGDDLIIGRFSLSPAQLVSIWPVPSSTPSQRLSFLGVPWPDFICEHTAANVASILEQNPVSNPLIAWVDRHTMQAILTDFMSGH
jgi:hypothetical protein